LKKKTPAKTSHTGRGKERTISVRIGGGKESKKGQLQGKKKNRKTGGDTLFQNAPKVVTQKNSGSRKIVKTKGGIPAAKL